MKFIPKGVLVSTPKILTAVALSTLLVACGGGGTSGDGTTIGTTDGLDAGTTDGLDGGTDSGTTDGTDLGLDDGGTTDTVGDGFTENGEPDADNDGISDVAENDVCKGRGGSDPGSTNDSWRDNCNLEYRINKGDPLQKSPFYHSLYVMGAQRVLYCREHGGVAADADAFADGFFGEKTLAAVREFQAQEELVVDGEIGPNTWGKMQELVVAAFIESGDTDYDWHGVAQRTDAEATFTIDCSTQVNFFGRIDPDTQLVGGWELSKTAGSTEKTAFSISSPAP